MIQGIDSHLQVCIGVLYLLKCVELPFRLQVGRLFTPQVGSTRPYILATWFDLFQRRSLEDTFDAQLGHNTMIGVIVL